MSGPDYILDLGGGGAREEPREPEHAPVGRRWLSILWRCCNCYGRVYRDPAAPRYTGRCPSCGKQLSVAVGPRGTDSRFFEAW